MPRVLNWLTRQVNKKLRFGYDVGKGYAMGEEEVQMYIDTLIENRIISKYFGKRIQENRLSVIKELGMKNQPYQYVVMFQVWKN